MAGVVAFISATVCLTETISVPIVGTSSDDAIIAMDTRQSV